MAAKGKNRLCSPIVVWPSITTCDFKVELLPIVTLSPMIQYGPIVTLSPIVADSEMIAVAVSYTHLTLPTIYSV